MRISFANKKLEKLASDVAKCRKALGQLRSEILLRRLSDMEAAADLEETRHLPGHYHELSGNRKG